MEMAHTSSGSSEPVHDCSLARHGMQIEVGMACIHTNPDVELRLRKSIGPVNGIRKFPGICAHSVSHILHHQMYADGIRHRSYLSKGFDQALHRTPIIEKKSLVTMNQDIGRTHRGDCANGTLEEFDALSAERFVRNAEVPVTDCSPRAIRKMRTPYLGRRPVSFTVTERFRHMTFPLRLITRKAAAHPVHAERRAD